MSKILKNNQIKFIPFKRQYLGLLTDLIHYTVKKCYPECYAPPVVEYYLEYHSEEELLKKSESAFIILGYFDKKLVASGYLLGDEIGGVYVLPEYQSQGIGTQVVKKLLEKSSQVKLTKVWLDSTPLAVILYKKLGFTIEKDCVMHVNGGAPLPYFRMTKTLVSE